MKRGVVLGRGGGPLVPWGVSRNKNDISVSFSAVIKSRDLESKYLHQSKYNTVHII